MMIEGTPFGRYRLLELLGRGGMGEVWRAHDTVIDRTVAIKTLLPHFAEDRTFEQRFRREARAAARLDEPHVVPIYDVGEIDGRLYVAMRLIKGQDLQTLLDRGPLEPGRSVGIVEQVASALDAAHQAGLVHRDIKPSNILVTDDDFAYLIDFGIARAAGETGITSTGATIGTWSYMAPERFSSGEIEPSSDIYALACVLYQSLTGRLPFPGTTLEQIAMAHMTAPPPKPSAQRPGISTAMDDVIAAGLAKGPRDRYPTPKDLAHAARAALNQDQAETVAAPASGRPATKSVSVGSRRRRLASGASLAIILLVGIIASAWRPWEEHQSGSANTMQDKASTANTPTLTASSAVAPNSLPPALLPTTTTVTNAYRYALPGCYSKDDPPTERPAAVTFQTCADGGQRLESMSWSFWGAAGAQGTGILSYQVCEPSCAEGHREQYAINVSAFEARPAVDSGCPTDMMFYSEMILSFPASAPNSTEMATDTTYLGRPAIRFTTSPGGSARGFLGRQVCY
ncbi:serine/threonine-protein kinase [Mycobacterium sp. E2699]|uniref:serine/threonine-protein kinase n=1 Tax=Mycobacterium sp. E2699 TaxID=1834137 RepID=UPI001E494EB1|nr:serine/threonine-protein kinase [Mycobacterium sp. E2699]